LLGVLTEPSAATNVGLITGDAQPRAGLNTRHICVSIDKTRRSADGLALGIADKERAPQAL